MCLYLLCVAFFTGITVVLTLNFSETTFVLVRSTLEVSFLDYHHIYVGQMALEVNRLNLLKSLQYERILITFII